MNDRQADLPEQYGWNEVDGDTGGSTTTGVPGS